MSCRSLSDLVKTFTQKPANYACLLSARIIPGSRYLIFLTEILSFGLRIWETWWRHITFRRSISRWRVSRQKQVTTKEDFYSGILWRSRAEFDSWLFHFRSVIMFLSQPSTNNMQIILPGSASGSSDTFGNIIADYTSGRLSKFREMANADFEVIPSTSR